MPTLEQYQRYGEELERELKLKTAPIAVKMLAKESDIPAGAFRPMKEKGQHLAQCQAFSLSRRRNMTVALLKEDQWCWAPLLAYGLVKDPKDEFLNSVTSFPRFEYGRYIGMVTAPLKNTTFVPDAVMIYSDTAQLRDMLMVIKFQEKANIKSEFDPIDSCAYAIVPTIKDNQYRITLPDPGEASRALANDDEIILSVPPDRLEKLTEGVKKMAENKQNPADWSHMLMQADFPRPDFYNDIFKKLGLDTEKK
jgi:uncharacterized protein (DUF169 family)